MFAAGFVITAVLYVALRAASRTKAYPCAGSHVDVQRINRPADKHGR